MTIHQQNRCATLELGVIAFLAVATLLGCSDQPDPIPKPPLEDPADSSRMTAQELEQLEALGYIDASPTPADVSKSGVVLWDRERSHPGYTLYTDYTGSYAALLGNDGEVVHSWTYTNTLHWIRCELMSNGDILIIGTEKAGDKEKNEGTIGHRYLLRMDWNGGVVWTKKLPVHHDVEVTPDGRILTLTLRLRDMPALSKTVPVRDDYLTLLTADGEFIEDRSLIAAFRSNPREVDFLSRPPKEDESGNPFIDLIHANSVEWMHREKLFASNPIFGPGNILVTSRKQNAAAIVQWDTGQVVWAWGQGQIEAPHGAEVTDAGTILLLDNGFAKRGWSRAVEVNPASKEIIWEYRAPKPTDFYTRSRGAAQRLPNGNTLITSANKGRAFEVTPDGTVVWDFFNPHLTQRDRRVTIGSLKRYEIDFVEKILRDKVGDHTANAD
jgi:hypothetical protein